MKAPNALIIVQSECTYQNTFNKYKTTCIHRMQAINKKIC